MMNAELISTLANAIGSLVDNLVAEKIKPLQEELALIKSLQDSWVNTKEAEKITGIKSQALKKERERPGTVIEFKLEGTRPFYLRTSLLEYSAKKTVRRHAGRILSAQSHWGGG